MTLKKYLETRVRGWVPKELKKPTQALQQPIFKTEVGPLFVGLGAGSVVLGLGFCFFSSYHIDGNLPSAIVLDIISHYLEGIAVGCAFLILGVALIVFGAKKSPNYFSTRIQAMKNWIYGWIPKELQNSNATMAAHASIMFERDKAVKLKVVSVLLGVLGVLWGWSAAGYAYIYFVGVGVTSYYATVYSVILWLIVMGAFWLAAFKLKRIQQFLAKGRL